MKGVHVRLYRFQLAHVRCALYRSPAIRRGRDGRALFENHCGYCHLTFGMGTNLLIKQRLAVGASPATALLANRDDLTSAYVHAVVRMGKGAMPPQTRVDITDAELDSVAAYLARGK